MVVEFLLARYEHLAVDGYLEEAATLVVGKELDGERGEAVRLAQPLRVAGRDVQLEQAVRDVGAPGSVEAAVRARQRAEEERAQRDRLADAPRLRERRQHQPVPRRNRLVVTERLRTMLAELEEARTRLLV